MVGSDKPEMHDELQASSNGEAWKDKRINPGSLLLPVDPDQLGGEESKRCPVEEIAEHDLPHIDNLILHEHHGEDVDDY